MSEKREIREIKVPLSQVWREFRMRFVPAGVFICGIAAAVYLWSITVVGPTLIGEVSPVQSLVVTPDAGNITNLLVKPFQIVKAGDPIVEISGSSVRLMTGNVQDLRNRIAMSQLEIRSIVDRERVAFDYQSLRISTFKYRADLAEAKAALPTVEGAFERNQKAWDEKVLSYNEYELSLRERDSMRARITELETLVNDAESRLKQIEHAAAGFTNVFSKASLPDVISKLDDERKELEESRRDSLVLRAPIDGIVGNILCQKGQTVMAGDIIMTIHAMEADRIVAFVRQGTPLPTKGSQVRVRCRSQAREEALSRVEEIGFRYEPITNQSLLRPGLLYETGMPIGVTMPPALKSLLRPGELVDLALEP